MTNRLIDSASLYLRKHAENPIDWWPWCEEALATAQAQDKPIFLSVGYSSCHWCTVMEGEAFSDRQIADYMNAHFLPIKVDREERPDIDSIYMQAVQIMTGQGGWPLNVFLTPSDRVPFYGGTYFPLEPRYGRPGFLQVLQTLRNFYDTRKEDLQNQGQKLMGYLRSTTTLAGGGQLDQSLLERGLEKNTAVIAQDQQGPNFPMIPYANLVLASSRWTDQQENEAIAVQRGLALALGGIYDHAAGGFHRYTVDGTWTVPHFEKMLYDNGQIVEYLANLWRRGVQEPALARAIDGTSQWLKREMTAAQGFFYAAQDADNFVLPTDVEPEEGRFYTWTYADLEQLLEVEELAALSTHFYLNPQGNFEDGLIVLQRRQGGELPASVETALAKLFRIRYGQGPELNLFPPARNNQEAKTHAWPGRIPPVTDTKMILSWNSLMISGLATAAAVLNKPDYFHQAIGSANFILDQQWQTGRLQRLNYEGIAQVDAQAEDYAFLIKALLDLHQASLVCDLSAARSTDWLATAVRVQEEFDRYLWATEGSGYYTTEATADLILQERQWMDNATPAANGVAIANLMRLFLLTENLAYLDRAEQALQAFSGIMQSSPTGCPSLFGALGWYFHPTLIRTNAEVINTLLPENYLPTAVYKLEPELPAETVALVCEGLTCQEPATSMEQLQEQLQLL
uniref:Spermatogenesis-associated protein 20-like TRX domain-containing protein n=1 Tax=Cyanothece sp. (strain PCC 7425 / ATCC 29141) TaxID=395961 RepID=B8HTW3_CYAP4